MNCKVSDRVRAVWRLLGDIVMSLFEWRAVRSLLGEL